MSRDTSMSMLDLFRLEAETQTQVLSSGLLELERHPTAADQLEQCMRAAHSLLARSLPPRAKRAITDTSTSFMRSSSSVRATATGKPGLVATGAK